MLNEITMGKKNLEQLFKDTFRDFHEAPDEKVWESIEASLDKKKQKKRIIPIWWQLGGVAAALAILFYVVDPFGTDIEKGEDQIISDTENTAMPDQTDENVGEKDLNDPSSITATENVADATEESETSNTSNTEDVQNASRKDFGTAPKRQVAEADKKIDSDKDAMNSKVQGHGQKETLAVANTTYKKNSHQDKLSTEKQLQDNLSKEKEAIAQNNVQNPSLEKQAVSDIQGKKEEETIAMNEEEKEESGISIFDAIKEQEAEEELAAQSNAGKWSVGPSVAPVYFNATGDGSPIHSDFSSNSKSGNFNLSYGLNVAYEVGKKVKIRSGIHKVNYGYDTNDVSFSSTLRSSSNEMIANINYSQNSENIVVQSTKKAYNSPSDVGSKEVLNEMPLLNGKMVQQLGYIEVPLEVNYAMVDKKFGVDLIGGVSSLFLVDNAVLLESQDLVTEVGEANNANSVNFSANVGMGLNYEFSPKVQLNIEPVFKYQLNTFSKTAGVFQPFSIGVYSGVSFKF